MSYLQWNLDTEEGIDIVDPVGDLCIIGDEGKLVEKYTYLDSFFEALVEAAYSIEAGKGTIVDPIVEPNDIYFELQEDCLKITCGEQIITILNADRFVKDVRESVTKLLKILDKQSELQKQPKRKLTRLREYSIVKT
jgi:hypothetical protein